MLRYLADQELATVVVPDDQNLVIERVRDDVGGLAGVCFDAVWEQGFHAPWAMAATAKRCVPMVDKKCGDNVDCRWFCAALSGDG